MFNKFEVASIGGLPGPAFLGKAIGAITGGLLGGAGSKTSGVQTGAPIDIRTEDQKKTAEKLAPFLIDRIGKGLPEFTGDRVAGLSDIEQTGQDLLADALQGTNRLGAAVLPVLEERLAGDPSQRATDLFTEFIEPARERAFQRDVLPAIREQFVKGGRLSSSSRQEAERRAGQEFTDEGSLLQAQLIQQERDREAGLLGLAPQLAQFEDFEQGAKRAAVAAGLGAQPRLIEQAKLDTAFQEFIRTQPELNPILDRVMSFIQVPQQQLVGVQQQPTTSAAAFQGAAPALGGLISGIF